MTRLESPDSLRQEDCGTETAMALVLEKKVEDQNPDGVLDENMVSNAVEGAIGDEQSKKVDKPNLMKILSRGQKQYYSMQKTQEPKNRLHGERTDMISNNHIKLINICPMIVLTVDMKKFDVNCSNEAENLNVCSSRNLATRAI